MTTSFYPPTYERTETPSDYMKLTEGEHRIRILRAPIIGFETWGEDGKPIRTHTMQEAVNAPSRDGTIKEFHALIVWDYAARMVRLINVTQRGIQDWLYEQSLDEDWADPTQYDIVIKRVGKGLSDTKYTLTPKPHKPLDSTVQAAYQAVTIDDEQYFTGGHPIVRDTASVPHPVDPQQPTSYAQTYKEKLAQQPPDDVSEVADVADDVPF